MISIRVELEGFDKAINRITGIGKQVEYAAAVALTRTAKAVEARIPDALERDLDRPTPFTKRGTFVRAARKGSLEAIVGFKDRQAEYLRYQIEGGTRVPKNKALRLPSAIGLNEFGNLPKGVIQQLISVAKKEARLGKVRSRRIKVSSKVEIFYGDPADVGGHRFPPGIYKRVALSGGRHQLIPLIVFPRQPAKYRKRFDFMKLASETIAAEWPRNFQQALSEAMSSAR